MNSKKLFFMLFLVVSISYISIVIVTGTSPSTYEQPTIGVRNTRILLEEEGYQFRDLNKNGELDPYEDWRLSAEDRAEDLVSQMTVKEKAGAMLHVNIMSYDDVVAKINDKYAGTGVDRSTYTAEAYVEYANNIQETAEATRLGIPFAISTDPRNHEGGSQYGVSLVHDGMTMWPQPIGFGAIVAADEGDGVDLIKKAGNTIRQEYRAVGISVALHPQIDLFTDPRWGRTSGNFATENAELTGKLGAAYIQGLQGSSLGSTSVSAMAKHFSGGGPQEDGIDAHFEEGQNQVYPGGKFEYHHQPFKDAIGAGVAAIMPYYGVPVGQTSEDVGMAFNKEVIRDILKTELGFEGIICTDWGVIDDVPSRGGFHGRSFGVEDLTKAERVAKALEAGIDQFGGLDNPTPILDAVDQGLVAEERLDSSVKKILVNKITLGLFENPFVDAANASDVLGKNQTLADEAQVKSTILLQNTGDVLPLQTAQADTKVYIYGKTADEVSTYGVIGVDNASDADIALVRVVAPYAIVPSGAVSTPNGLIFKMHGGPLVYGPYEKDDGSSYDLTKYYIYEGDIECSWATNSCKVGDNVTQVTDSKNYRAANYSDLEHIQEVVANKGANTTVIVDVYMERAAVLTEFKDTVDVIFASFGISDSNLLTLIFGENSPTAKLPFGLPSSMDVAEAQAEDVPSAEETDIYGKDNPFPYQFGLTY